MHTLLEYFTYIKGVEYLIAIAFLLSFSAFWWLVDASGKKTAGKKVFLFIPLSVVAGVVIVIARSVTSTPTPASLPVSESAPKVFTFGSLVELYGPSAFDHEIHQGVTNNCTLCHHHSGDRFPPCKQCHSMAVSLDDLGKPDLARVYHRRCISCHREKDKGPLICTGCHTKAAIPPLSMRHPLTARDKCLTCHRGNIPGVPGVPDDHAGATDGVCQLCHKPLAELVSPTLIPKPDSAPPRDTKAENKAAHSPAMKPAGPAKLRHEVAGRENCTMCHVAANLPLDHAGRGPETCLACHEAQ